MSVQDVARKNKLIPNRVFGNPEIFENDRLAIDICDGTYVNIHECSNYASQKQTYSLHKYPNLVKPFLITCCDGYILEVLSPYSATDWDASEAKMERWDRFSDRSFKDSILTWVQSVYARIPAGRTSANRDV